MLKKEGDEEAEQQIPVINGLKKQIAELRKHLVDQVKKKPEEFEFLRVFFVSSAKYQEFGEFADRKDRAVQESCP